MSAPVALIIAILLASINPAFAGTKTIMAFGDSLTAGKGLPLAEAFPARLEARLKEKGYDVRVVNSGVSGETSSGGLARLEWTLQQKPDAVILETGANDMLRGVDPAVTRGNIAAILKTLKERKIPVLLTGMKAFSNLGPDYKARYERIFPALAQEYGAALYPFFLDGVALRPGLLQGDGLHPNAAGADAIAEKIAPYAEKLLK